MKLQFSLATLLVCVTVFSVVAVICATRSVPEYDDPIVSLPGGGIMFLHREPVRWRQPSGWVIWNRLITWEPPIILAMLGIFWSVRRLKSRRENGPPVG
jgi:hypothetical protein